MLLKLASRKSELARLQAYLVADKLKEQFPGIQIEFQFRESLGDKNLTDPLWQMPERGVFTEDFYQDLISEKADLVVHSWKDLPIQNRPETEVVATLPRADIRDLLLFKKSSIPKLKQHLAVNVFSSSPRRNYNLTPFLRDFLPFGNQIIRFNPVRGNVQTRVRKMQEDPDCDGLVLAKAALDRLLSAKQMEFASTKEFLADSLDSCHWMVLPLTENPSAAAQGALAIEIKSSRVDVKAALLKINDQETFDCVVSERNRLADYGGGCHQKIGVTHLHKKFGKVEFLKGLTDAGVVLDSKSLVDPKIYPDPAAVIKSTDRITIVKSADAFDKQKAPLLKDAFQLAHNNAYFVAHADAWPEELKQPKYIWTSGLATWKKLAEKGFWVNGCQESLGEKEDKRLSILLPETKWIKLTHNQAPQDESALVTYLLVATNRTIQPLVDNQFYWKSATLFNFFVTRQPEILSKQHYCGPGNTFDEIKKTYSEIKILWPTPK